MIFVCLKRAQFANTNQTPAYGMQEYTSMTLS